MNDTSPELVYRLASLEEWERAQETGAVPLRDIDEKDAYIHLSTETQVLETARLHFAGADDLLALVIPLAPIAEKVKFELAPKRGEAFPHLYGVLETSHVSSAVRLVREGEQFSFGEAL